MLCHFRQTALKFMIPLEINIQGGIWFIQSPILKFWHQNVLFLSAFAYGCLSLRLHQLQILHYQKIASCRHSTELWIHPTVQSDPLKCGEELSWVNNWKDNRTLISRHVWNRNAVRSYQYLLHEKTDHSQHNAHIFRLPQSSMKQIQMRQQWMRMKYHQKR